MLGDFSSHGVLDLAARLSPSRFETIQFFTRPKLGEMMDLICVKKTHVFLNAGKNVFKVKNHDLYSNFGWELVPRFLKNKKPACKECLFPTVYGHF